MRRFAFSALIMGVLVACGGANSTDLFSGDSTGGGGGGTDGGGNTTDGGGGGGGNPDSGGGGGGTTDSGGGGGGTTDAGSMKDAGVTSTKCIVDKGGVATGCNMDEVCVSPSCSSGNPSAGTCTKINMASTDYNPVCGCDTVNYWNGAVASAFLAGVKGNGACANPASCNGASGGNAKCGVVADAECAFEKPDVGGNACGVTVKPAACWGMPSSCPKVTQGVAQCGGGGCISLCDAIKNQTPYRVTSPACTIM